MWQDKLRYMSTHIEWWTIGQGQTKPEIYSYISIAVLVLRNAWCIGVRLRLLRYGLPYYDLLWGTDVHQLPLTHLLLFGHSEMVNVTDGRIMYFFFMYQGLTINMVCIRHAMGHLRYARNCELHASRHVRDWQEPDGLLVRLRPRTYRDACRYR